MQRLFSLSVAAWLYAISPTLQAADFQDEGPDHFIPIAEELLDTAIAHCSRGELEQARVLFLAIKEQLNPPPAVRELITLLEEGGCRARRSVLGQWDVRALIGHDDNVSQGIRASSLSLGPAIARVELPVGDNYRPIASPFAELTVSHSWDLQRAATLQLKVSGRHYASANAYDQSSINAMVRTPLQVLGRRMEVLGEWADLWLGGRHYHSALTAAAQAPIFADMPQWNVAAVAQTVRYHTQPQQNSDQFQAGITRHFQASPGKAVILGAMGIWDNAQGQRAGGDRTGINLHAAGEIRLTPWRLSGRIGLTHWATRQDFLPGLIDEKRRNKLLNASAQAEYPIGPGQSLQLDLQLRNSRDTISLYAYRSVSWSVSWNARF